MTPRRVWFVASAVCALVMWTAVVAAAAAGVPGAAAFAWYLVVGWVCVGLLAVSLRAGDRRR